MFKSSMVALLAWLFLYGSPPTFPQDPAASKSAPQPRAHGLLKLTPDDARRAQELEKSIEPALDAIMVSSSGFHSIAFFLGLPTPTRARHFRAVREIDRVVYALIARGRDKLKSS